MPLLFNKYTDKVIPPSAVYIGRPSKWGNDMSLREIYALFPGLSMEEAHQRAVDWYRSYLSVNPRLQAELPELAGKDLVCWCFPLPCHGDVLLEMANKL